VDWTTIRTKRKKRFALIIKFGPAKFKVSKTCANGGYINAKETFLSQQPITPLATLAQIKCSFLEDIILQISDSMMLICSKFLK
jgi:hypothetical protein